MGTRTAFYVWMMWLFSVQNSFSQSIENIRTTANNEQVIIDYDLVGDTRRAVNIRLRVKIGDAKTITATRVSGDVNQVLPGRDKRILWAALEEMGEFDAEVVAVLTIESNYYNEAKIGAQVWMKENLNQDRFKNGDLIPEAKTNAEWIQAGKNRQPAWCYHENNSNNEKKYGKLYNYWAVIDPRGLAPDGWRISTDSDWTILTNYLKGSLVAGKYIKSNSGWLDGGNGSNKSGFTALPGGYRNGDGGFFAFGYTGTWWCISSGTSRYTGRSLDNSDLITTDQVVSGSFGFSVRCIK